MNNMSAALWAEWLKARRSKLAMLVSAGFLILPLAGGLFMIILKNPEQARALGIINAKAQLTAGVADWPSFWIMITQGVAMGGAILFTLLTAWVFGREFSDHTAKEILALPTPRSVIVGSKFVLLALWTLALSLIVFLVSLVIGAAVGIPGWSSDLAWTCFWLVVVESILNMLLMPFVALFASSGRGYLPPIGWTIIVLVITNLLVVLGWGDWFPWAVPALISLTAKPNADAVALHSYLVVLLACFVGLAATFSWWRSADQTK